MDSDADEGSVEVFGRDQAFVAARHNDINEETKNKVSTVTVLGKRKHNEREEQSEDESDDGKKKSKKNKKDKKHKKDKKDKKDKKEKKASKRARQEPDQEEEKEERYERWVNPERNPWTGRSWSERYFEIL